MGFGGWPVKFAPCGLGAGAMVNAVYGTKGRIGRDPAALAKRKAERAVRLRTQLQRARARALRVSLRAGARGAWPAGCAQTRRIQARVLAGLGQHGAKAATQEEEECRGARGGGGDSD